MNHRKTVGEVSKEELEKLIYKINKRKFYNELKQKTKCLKILELKKTGQMNG